MNDLSLTRTDTNWMSTVAGVICIICGCLALLGFLILAAFGSAFAFAPDVDSEEFVIRFIWIAFAIGALCSLVAGFTATLGGISTLRNRNWGWILAGAIASMLICLPLGLAALILIVIAEQDLRTSATARATSG